MYAKNYSVGPLVQYITYTYYFAHAHTHTYIRPHTHLEELRDHAINGQAVFTNSELSLKYIDVYGFDFDYTLVHYKQSVLRLIYGLAKNRLVEQLNVSYYNYCVIIIIVFRCLYSTLPVSVSCPLTPPLLFEVYTVT